MKIKHLLIISTMIMTSSQIFAESVNLLTSQDIKNPNSAMPKNFRDLSNLGINAIASAQFSEEQLKEVRKKYPNEKITIIDLRRENHGFVNGEVVVWHSVFEKGNDRKSTAEILSEEKYLLKTAQKNGEIVINTVKKRDRENGWYSEVEPKVVVVKRVSNEENLAKENGFSYKRFSVRDFDMPDEKEFNKMVKFIKKLPKDQKLYVHCAGGKGRTDIIKNGKNVDLEEIFARQNKLGAARLDEISEEEAWTKDLAQIRLKMLQDFYEKETD